MNKIAFIQTHYFHAFTTETGKSKSSLQLFHRYNIKFFSLQMSKYIQHSSPDKWF